MSVYKSLTTSDVVVTPFKVNKSFTIYGTEANARYLTEVFKSLSNFRWANDNNNLTLFESAGIGRYLGENIPFSTSSSFSIPFTNSPNKVFNSLTYSSIKQLYYTDFIRSESGSTVLTSSIGVDGVVTGETGTQPSFYNYLNNTLLQTRFFPTSSSSKIGVISIPSSMFGEYINPGSFELEVSSSARYAPNQSYFTRNYNDIITDDGEGNLISSNTSKKVGDIIYQHGMVIITNIPTTPIGNGYGNGTYGTDPNITAYSPPDGNLLEIIKGENIKISFQSTMTIYESQYKCTFNPNEYTYSQNPTTILGSSNSGIIQDFATGSYFQPYITTVGLYNSTNELIAVGKLAQPLQSSNVTDTTILVNLDL